MKFVFIAMFVASSSVFASDVKKVTVETTPAGDTKTTTVTEKKSDCIVVDGKEDCSATHSKSTKTTKTKKSY